MTRSIGIHVFDNVEVLDFAGPYEVSPAAALGTGGFLPTQAGLLDGRELAPATARRMDDDRGRA